MASGKTFTIHLKRGYNKLGRSIMDGTGPIVPDLAIDTRILKTLHAAIYRCDYSRSRSDIFVSEEIEHITGWRADQFLNGEVAVIDLFLETERAGIKASFETQMLERGHHVIDAKIVRRDGCVRWIKDVGVRTTDETGRLVIDGMIMDVTNQRALELDRDRARRRAENYAGFADRALDVIAHEIRTPLNAVYGYSQLLQAYGDAYSREKLADYVGNILEASEQLKALSDSALKSLEIRQAGPGKKSPFALVNVVTKVRKTLRQRFPHARFFCDESTLSHCVALGAPELFAQIFEDLLQNAVKHNPEGVTVEITAHRLRDDGLAIVVDDDGVGVPDENLRDVFGAFLKDRATENLETRGFGLGLSRVIAAAQTLNVDVYARRSPLGGLRVVLVLPGDQVMETPTARTGFDLCYHYRVS